MFNSELLQKFIPLIDNNNFKNEYYLTDIVKIIKNNTSLNIDTYLVNKNFEYQIHGINTQDELKLLEQKYPSI